MAFKIDFSREAFEDLRALKKSDQVQIVAVIRSQLRYQPNVVTRNRKRLRPNEVAQWELRVGKFRILYNVDDRDLSVVVEAVAFKVGNVFFVRGMKRDI